MVSRQVLFGLIANRSPLVDLRITGRPSPPLIEVPARPNLHPGIGWRVVVDEHDTIIVNANDSYGVPLGLDVSTRAIADCIVKNLRAARTLRDNLHAVALRIGHDVLQVGSCPSFLDGSLEHAAELLMSSAHEHSFSSTPHAVAVDVAIAIFLANVDIPYP